MPEPSVSTAGPLFNSAATPMAVFLKTEQTNRKIHYAEYSFHFSMQRSTANSGLAYDPAKTAFLSVTCCNNRLQNLHTGARPDGTDIPSTWKRTRMPRAFPFFFEPRKFSILLFIFAFRTENRYALFLKML
jgi:hypothetical protein